MNNSSLQDGSTRTDRCPLYINLVAHERGMRSLLFWRIRFWTFPRDKRPFSWKFALYVSIPDWSFIPAISITSVRRFQFTTFLSIRQYGRCFHSFYSPRAISWESHRQDCTFLFRNWNLHSSFIFPVIFFRVITSPRRSSTCPQYCRSHSPHVLEEFWWAWFPSPQFCCRLTSTALLARCFIPLGCCKCSLANLMLSLLLLNDITLNRENAG